MKGAPSSNDFFKSLIPQNDLTLPLLYFKYDEYQGDIRKFYVEQLGSDAAKFAELKEYTGKVAAAIGRDTEKLAQFKIYVQEVRFRKLFGQMLRHETDLPQIRQSLSTSEYSEFVPYAQNFKRHLQLEQQKSTLRKEITSLQQQVVEENKTHGQRMNQHQKIKDNALDEYVTTVGRLV